MWTGGQCGYSLGGDICQTVGIIGDLIITGRAGPCIIETFVIARHMECPVWTGMV